MSNDRINVALIGNPNTGKSTLFNALTGLNQKVGNYPGVTVECKLGTTTTSTGTIQWIDLPGTYSLAARSPDEQIAIDCLVHQRPELPAPDVIVSIVDATNLDRHLFVTTQLLEVGKPVVLAVNLIDLAETKGIKVDFKELSVRLGIPVVPIQANRKIGLEQLQAEVLLAARAGVKTTSLITFPVELEAEANGLLEFMPQNSRHLFLARRLLIDIDGEIEKRLISQDQVSNSVVGVGWESTKTRIDAARARVKEAGINLATIEARLRFGVIRPIIASCVKRSDTHVRTLSDRLDRVLTHRILGTIIFFCMMFFLFEMIFFAAKPLMDLIGEGKDWLADLVRTNMATGPFRALLTDGVIAGVGSVITFVPQIMILFGFIAILEDCGYMTRAAFLMDRIMSRCGLNGKSFIPMLSSVACAVPAIMATRVIESRRDRLATILVAPLMSCSARLPLYILLIETFFPDSALQRGLLLFCMYMIGFIAAPIVALILKRTLLKAETPIFVMELPPFRMPQIRQVLRKMFEAAYAFIARAGTLILASMILIWALLYFPTQDQANGTSFETRYLTIEQELDEAETEEKKDELANDQRKLLGEWRKQSYLARFGQSIQPVFEPLGWNWQITVAAMASFPAREVVVGTLGILYSQGEVDSDDEDSRKQLGEAIREDWTSQGAQSATPIAFSLMVFFALCCQCVSTLAVIRRETRSWSWPVFTFTYMTVLAYLSGIVTYQILRWVY
jgi:ferrous iron transport protein B